MKVCALTVCRVISWRVISKRVIAFWHFSLPAYIGTKIILWCNSEIQTNMQYMVYWLLSYNSYLLDMLNEVPKYLSTRYSMYVRINVFMMCVTMISKAMHPILCMVRVRTRYVHHMLVESLQIVYNVVKIILTSSSQRYTFCIVCISAHQPVVYLLFQWSVRLWIDPHWGE